MCGETSSWCLNQQGSLRGSESVQGTACVDASCPLPPLQKAAAVHAPQILPRRTQQHKLSKKHTSELTEMLFHDGGEEQNKMPGCNKPRATASMHTSKHCRIRNRTLSEQDCSIKCSPISFCLFLRIFSQVLRSTPTSGQHRADHSHFQPA